MRVRSLVVLQATLVAIALAGMYAYFEKDWTDIAVTFSLTFAISYFLFHFLFQRFIVDKIKLIYKLIHSLKLGKDLKEALGDRMGNDPLYDVEKEVLEWSKAKKMEIDALKGQEKFRREFLTNISHEFKTPLFAIQGYLDALMDGMVEEDPEMATQFLQKASRNIDRLSFLVQDLDEISKLESGEIAINYAKFDIVDLVKEVLDSLEDKATALGIQFEFKVKYQNPSWVRADREKIHQVLFNLIDNSIKYGKSTGTTAVRIYELFGQYLIEVTDNGTGIEEKYLNRVFERFFRTEKSRSREVGGSGLGLAIVKHIIEAHQQTISLRSTEGLGTTFGFTLEKFKPFP